MKKNMEVVSQFAGLGISYRVIGMIVGTVIAFHVGVNVLDVNANIARDLFSLFSALCVVTMGTILVLRYKTSTVFGRSVVFLTLGFVSVAIGEILVIAGVKTYPSIDSMLFFGLYVFLSLYLYINISAFSNGFGFKNLLIISPIVLGLISLFYVTTYLQYGHSDFNLHYCGASVVGTSILAALALRGFHAVKKIPLGRSWRLLALGIVILTLNDIWFHYLDTLGAYSAIHEVNMLFYGSYMLIAYALYMHRKAI